MSFIFFGITVHAEDGDVVLSNPSKSDNFSTPDNISFQGLKLLKITKHDKRDDTDVFRASFSANGLGIIDMLNSGTRLTQNFTLIPYASLHFRFFNGKPFVPEVIIEESGIFNFDRIGVRVGSKRNGYNRYYVKIPLMLSIPYFTYKSMFNADFSYSTTISSFKVDNSITARNNVVSGGDISLSGSILEARLYLDSPIALSQTFFNHSYAGLYYTEMYDMRMATPPTGATDNYLLSTFVRGGGFFYDMAMDTPLKGLDFAILIKLGYGDIHVNDSYNISYGNIYNLLLFTIKAGISYRYMFNKYIGLMADAGISYISVNTFFTTADEERYSVAIGGNILYNFGLSLIF